MSDPAGFGAAEAGGRVSHDAEALQHAMEQLPALAWTTDHNLRITAPLHLRHPQTFHVPVPATGVHVTAVFGSAQGTVAASHEQALQGQPATFELERDGRHYQVRIQPLRDRAGIIVGAIGVGVDVTERTQMEVQIQAARKMDVVARLAGGMAHDLNNVLTIIVSYAQFLLDRLDRTGDAYEDAQVIHDAARRAVTALGKLLAFSRRQVLRPEVVELGALLQRRQATLRDRFPEHIELCLRPSSEPCHARIDQEHVLQAIANVAINAAEAMPDGGSVVVETTQLAVTETHATTRAGVAPGDYVVVAVSDTGTGMTKTVREQAFEPFFSTKDSRGRGLGLSSTYGIVKQSGGYLWIDSEPGRGTTFKIYLPRVGQPAESQPRSVSTPPAQPGASRALRVDRPPSSPPLPSGTSAGTHLAQREP